MKMIKKIAQNVVFLFVIFATTSCDDYNKIVDLEMPEDPLQLAVFGFLSPGDSITEIYVSHTTPLLGKYRRDISIHNAKVNIICNSQTYTLHYDDSTDTYKTSLNQLPIEENETYKLEVSANGYKKVTSTITIINRTKTDLQFVKFLENRDDYGVKNKIKLKWKDNPNTKDYYIITGRIISGGYYFEYKNCLQMYFYDDKEFTSTDVYSTNMEFMGEPEYGEVALIKIAFFNVDEHYFLYHKTLSVADNINGNPFSEPVEIYSNIENGVGVFCSYTKEILELEWFPK